MSSVDDIPALVRRLRSRSTMTQLRAARDLAHLANESEEMTDAVAAAGSLLPLLQLFETSHQRFRRLQPRRSRKLPHQ